LENVVAEKLATRSEKKKMVVPSIELELPLPGALLLLTWWDDDGQMEEFGDRGPVVCLRLLPYSISMTDPS
jgi:hypothetical protein